MQKILDEKKICFIIAVNDEKKFALCIEKIKQLKVPRGMKITVQAMRGYSSMTSAYQSAMEKSDAKYKIYIHQDAHLVEKRMLEKLIDAFRENLQVGLIGVVGAKKLPDDAVWWHISPDRAVGMIADPHNGEMKVYRHQEIKNTLEAVEAIDGVFMATQYDVDWRGDLFIGWDFYDISQCKEFNRAGFKVGVIRQEEPWVYHHCVQIADKNLLPYHTARQIFLEEYMWGMRAEETPPSLKRKPLTDIVILSYNTLDMTRACIESIRRYTEPDTYQIIVIDNASTDGSVEYLKEQTDIKCVFNKENVGFPKGCNQGIEIAKSTEILLLNSDTIVTARWLANLRYALYKSEKTGAVSCMTNNCSNEQALSDILYSDWQEMQAFADRYNKIDEAKWIPNFRLVAFCMLIKREVVDKIGGLDERFTPGNYEDNDYSFRIRQAGYDLLLCKDTFIHHFGSSSFTKSMSEEERAEKLRKYKEILACNKKYFCDKWQVEANYDSWDLAIEQLPEKVMSAERIIHIGCRYGRSLFRLKEFYPEADLKGISFSARMKEIASWGFDVEYCTDAENKLFDYLKGKYDLIYISNFPLAFEKADEICGKLKEYLVSDGVLCFTTSDSVYLIKNKLL